MTSRTESYGMVEAEWQSGHAEDCKSLYVGSIPASASTSRRFRQGRRKTGQAGQVHKAGPDEPRSIVKTGLEGVLPFLFPGSSVVEQAAVNRLVAGSNPARGAL